MKKLGPYSLFLLLLISGILLTGAGYAGEDSIYADYSRQNGWMTPALSLVFQGAKDGVFPWKLSSDPVQAAAEPDGGKETETMAADGNGDAGGEEEGTVSQNAVSGNSLSGVEASGDQETEETGEESSTADAAFTASDGSRYDRFGQLILPEAGTGEETAPSGEREQETAGTAEGTGTAEGGGAGAAEPSQRPEFPQGSDLLQGSNLPQGSDPVQGAELTQETVLPQQSGQPSSSAGQAASQEDGSQEEKTFVPVPESYFDDALFIGDSRTVGLYEYGGFQKSTVFFAKTSLTIYDLFEEPEKFAQLADGKKATLEEALAERKFGKIYIMLGINELGRGTTESFFRVYAEAVNRIRLLQPDALIFIQGIMRVGEEKNSTDGIFNNTNINARNLAISMMADNRSIFYLEINDAVCDENGNLISDYTFDQIHLKAKYYQLWKDYLFAHGVL